MDRKFADTTPASAPSILPVVAGSECWPTWAPPCKLEYRGLIWTERRLARLRAAEQDCTRFMAALAAEDV